MGAKDQSGRDRIEAEAADWLAKLDRGRADIGAFEAWRAGDPACAAAFAQLDAAWSRLDRAKALRGDGPIDPDLLAPPQLSSRRWMLRAASFGAIAVLGAGSAVWLTSGRAYAETDIGERRAVRLPDGSLIELNTDSRASWRFTTDMREVSLERGEAALDVTHDTEARPFVLKVAGRSLTLQQGTFNARLRRSGAEIVPIRIAEAASSADAFAEGTAILVSTNAERIEQLAPLAVDAAGAWRRGEIIFDGQTMGEAVAEYNRYLTAKIEIADPTLAELRVGGRFTTPNPTAFIEAAHSAFGISAVTRPDGGLVLVREE